MQLFYCRLFWWIESTELDKTDNCCEVFCFAFFPWVASAKLLCHSTLIMAAMYRCVYLNHNTAQLKLQGHQHVTPSLFLCTHTTNKMYTMKNIFQASRTQSNKGNNWRAYLLRGKWRSSGCSPPCPYRWIIFSEMRRELRGAREGGRDSTHLGCQEPAMAASLSSQTELNWCQSHWLLLQWAASLGFAF